MLLTSLDPDASRSNFVRREPSPTLWRIYGSSNSQSASRTIRAYWKEERGQEKGSQIYGFSNNCIIE